MGAAVLFVVLIVPLTRAETDRNVETALSPPVALLADVLVAERAAGRDIQPTIDRAAQNHTITITIVDREHLPLGPRDLARLERHEVVRIGDGPWSTLYVKMDATNDFLRYGPVSTPRPRAKWRIGSVGILVLSALLVGVYLFMRPVRRRLEDLSRIAAMLGRGDMSVRAEIGSPDTIGDLAAVFNRMADELQRLLVAQEELLHMTSHELRTPIQRLHFLVERIRNARDAEERDHAIERMDRNLEDMDELIEELLAYVRLGEQRPQIHTLFDLQAMAGELCETLSDMALEITLVMTPVDGQQWVVKAAPRLIRRALSNLVTNAVRHAHARIEVRLEREGNMIHVNVDDDGAGVPMDERQQIFEPFHRRDDERTKKSRGVGLGLAIVRRIAVMHGGSAIALDAPLGGARFRFSFRNET